MLKKFVSRLLAIKLETVQVFKSNLVCVCVCVCVYIPYAFFAILFNAVSVMLIC